MCLNTIPEHFYCVYFYSSISPPPTNTEDKMEKSRVEKSLSTPVPSLEFPQVGQGTRPAVRPGAPPLAPGRPHGILYAPQTSWRLLWKVPDILVSDRRERWLDSQARLSSDARSPLAAGCERTALCTSRSVPAAAVSSPWPISHTMLMGSTELGIVMLHGKCRGHACPPNTLSCFSLCFGYLRFGGLHAQLHASSFWLTSTTGADEGEGPFPSQRSPAGPGYGQRERMRSHCQASSGGRAPISIANMEGVSFVGYKWGEARSVWDSLTGLVRGGWGLSWGGLPL